MTPEAQRMAYPPPWANAIIARVSNSQVNAGSGHRATFRILATCIFKHFVRECEKYLDNECCPRKNVHQLLGKQAQKGPHPSMACGFE